MKKIIVLFFVCVSLQLSAQRAEEKSVKNTFLNYKKAILASDGEEAVKWVDKNTVSYYGKMLEITLKGDSAKVAGLALMDKLTVLSLRHKIPRNEIVGLDGEQLFVYSIEKEMVAKNSVTNVEIGDVKITGDTADGELMANGQASALYFKFKKEEGQWKLDLTSLFGPTSEGLAKMIADQGMTENEFIFRALEMTSGRPVSDKIWSPK